MADQATATPPAEQPRFCKDCAYFIDPIKGAPDCAAPIAGNIDLVNGVYRRGCHLERRDDGACGPAGKLFVLQIIKSADSLAKSIPDVETCKERLEQFIAIIRSPEYIAMTSNRLFGDLDGSVTCDSAAEQTLSPSAPASDGLSDRTAD